MVTTSPEKIETENPHSKEIKLILEQLKTRNDGLSREEARRRLESQGPNRLEELEELSLFRILVDQINNPIVYLLTAAAVLAFIFGSIPEGIAIVVVLFLNTAIGFWMESSARRSMKSLKELSKVTAKVIRDGTPEEIDADQLVPGDIVKLQAGDLVPGDGRIMEESEMEVDESPLTGESVPVKKEVAPVNHDTPVADRSNMVFKGTAVTNGNGKVVIVNTGMDTELGSISEMVGKADKEQVPLNLKLQNLTKKLIWFTVGLAAAFFVAGSVAGEETYQLVQTSIAWTIAAIPEGLPIVASLALARGMLRLAKQDVIVKRLSAVETLGETTVIFTDKTGTLTKNRLTLDTVYLPGQQVNVVWKDKKAVLVNRDNPQEELDAGNEIVKSFFEIAVLCNDAEPENIDEEKTGSDVTGDPLEVALLEFARVFDPDRYKSLRKLERLDEEPFDSDDMLMGTVYEMNNKSLLFCKGAPEAVLQRCSTVGAKDGKHNFSEEERTEWRRRNDQLSERGLLVVAFAVKEIGRGSTGEKDVERDLMHDMNFVGLTGFIDPPREDVTDAVTTCLNAGVRVEMVTGDHPGTARNIARKVQLADDESDQVIKGRDLSKEDGRPDKSEVVKTRIFARVDPGQKLDLIQHYQDNGHIVAMTGDGVNDAPALKKADIGVAMGKKGTQVAQEVSDLVLKNDRFSSIVDAIREGRIIFGNIRKFIIYQLSYHLAEIAVIAVISFSVFHLPLLPLQLLFLNLLSDVFPALALGIGEGKKNIMIQPPKNPREPILNRQNWTMIILHGVILAVFISGAYFYALKGWGLSPEICNNVAFFTLAFAQLWHVFDMREPDEDIFVNQVTRNKYIWAALAFCSAVIIAAYLLPPLKDVLSFGKLEPGIWVLIAIVSLLPLITIQSLKEISKRSRLSF